MDNKTEQNVTLPNVPDINLLQEINNDAIKTIKIKNQSDLEKQTELLSQANKYLKAITADKDALLDPLKETAKNIKAKYKPAEDKLNAIIGKIREAMTVYTTEQNKLKQIKEQKIIDQLNEDKISIEKATLKIEKIQDTAVPGKTSTFSGNISFREKAQLVVTDPLLIPREYLIIDEALILKKLLSDPHLEIPGTKIEKIMIPINRTK